ncbi:YkgJ family cysteine cluster protein [Thermoanaerobacterium sp. DL9XJH110]|uniref:YkgJ family cysteine cluster protein n=1 Tax=Thermoanaerobacterium sp. DL9XJH110 TaxID=3386643 RepID=UPI003BB56511
MKTRIPEHKCHNCGECCGPVMATEKEIEKIRKYVRDMPKEYKEKLKNQEKAILTCPYRDIENKRCAIYPVRPTICRMFGVVKGMQCIYGNTAELDGSQFLDRTKEYYILPNFMELDVRVQELEEALREALKELYAHRKRHYLDSPTPGPVERKIEAVLKGEYKNV